MIQKSPPTEAVGLLNETDGCGLGTKLPAARGAAAMGLFRKTYQNDPESISSRVRGNRDVRSTGLSDVERGQGARTRSYVMQEVPFNGARTAAHFMLGLAEVFDLMEQGKW